MNANPAWLASRAIAAVSSAGRHFQITLRLGIPYEISPEEWACPVAVEGLQVQMHDIHGTDAWQALQLAQNLQAQLLGYFIDDGGELFWLDPREQLELAELFPRVPAPQEPDA